MMCNTHADKKVNDQKNTWLILSEIQEYCTCTVLIPIDTLFL